MINTTATAIIERQIERIAAIEQQLEEARGARLREPKVNTRLNMLDIEEDLEISLSSEKVCLADALLAEHKRVRAALLWYADETNHIGKHSDGYNGLLSNVDIDGGDKARAALMRGDKDGKVSSKWG